MSLIFHEADDSCAPFPHRILVKPAHQRKIKTLGIGKTVLIDVPEFVYIFCAECDHWILTKVPCSCSQLCHDLEELITSLKSENREQIVTNS